MIRVERECVECKGKRWLGDFDEQKYDIFHTHVPQEHCTLCKNRRDFDIVLTVLKEEANEHIKADSGVLTTGRKDTHPSSYLY